MSRQSAGILMFRRRAAAVEVLLAHPGGPLWEARDLGAWTFPKGQFYDDESPFAAAQREFQEETGFAVDGDFIDLGTVIVPSGKIIYCWAVEGDLDADAIVSNLFPLEWPRGSGQWQEFPEVDRGAWYGLEAARIKIFKSQLEFLDRLCAVL